VIGLGIGEIVEMERENSSFFDCIKDSGQARMTHEKRLFQRERRYPYDTRKRKNWED
jgi:hypothetical protein